MSVMLLQMEQRCRRALTSRTASASASASSELERRIWKASRCALLVPMPGSLRSSSISRAMGSANRDKAGLGLQRVVDGRDEHVRRHFAVRPLRVKIGGKAQGKRLVKRLAADFGSLHTIGDGGQHLAVGGEVRLIARSTMTGNDLGAVVCKLKHLVHALNDAVDGAAAVCVDDGISVVE